MRLCNIIIIIIIVIIIIGTSINGVPFSGNTGISSFRARSRLLLIGEAVIIAAHEIGHNWGSQHDDSSSSECSPSPDNGGKYLMYPIAQDGTASNNNVSVHVMYMYMYMH